MRKARGEFGRCTAIAACAAVAAGACGLGWTGERSGGAANLPTAAAGPYHRVPFDFDSPINEPYVLDDRAFSLEQPTALPRAAGGVRVWFGRVDPVTGAAAIAYAELPGLHDLPAVGPVVVLEATEPWERGRVTAPSVVDLGGGALALFYEGGAPDEPAIGRADSDDGGATWRKWAGNPVVAGVRAPGVAQLDGRWWLYAVEPGGRAIVRADSDDGLQWTPAERPAIEPRPGVDGAFDAYAVTDPHPLVRRTAAGRAVHGLFFAGADRPGEDGRVAIGYAGSFDADTWERFAGADPVLRSFGPPAAAPAAVVDGTSGILLFEERSAGRGRIAAAIHP